MHAGSPKLFACRRATWRPGAGYILLGLFVGVVKGPYGGLIVVLRLVITRNRYPASGAHIVIVLPLALKLGPSPPMPFFGGDVSCYV